MLSRATTRISPIYRQQQCRYFASGSYDSFNSRVNQLQSSYPSLFDESSYIRDAESIMSSYKSNVSSLISEYDSARQAIASSTGEDVFQELDESELINDLETIKRPKYTSLLSNMSDIQSKLEIGDEYVSNIIRLQKEQESASTVEQQNLKMIEIADYGDKIDEWTLSFNDPLNDSSDLGLPISDEELDQWVREQYHSAPDEVREQGGLSNEEHKILEENWMRTLDDKLVDVLKERDPSFDESKFREFCDVTNDIFHPHSIDHYAMSNYAKSLFRAALWQSKDRVTTVEQSMEIVSKLLEDERDDDPTIMRGVFEESPDTRFSSFAAFQLKITDPLFSAKLVEEVRIKLESVAIERAQKDVLRELQVPYLQSERQEVERELEESMSTNPANMQREIQVLKEEENSFNIDVPSLDAVLDEILPKKVWGNDISAVKQAILSYASGSGSLSDIDRAIDQTLNSNATADTSSLSDEEILDLSVKYHNSKYSNPANFNFRDFLKQAQDKRDASTILENRRIAKNKLSALNVDPLVINLVRILVEDGKTIELQKICEDYLDVMKRFRGEVEGSVTSAQELDDSTFEQIKNALESANPGKKLTLERLIDPGLQSGFIVKAGVQRFDFSLATLIFQGRSAVGTV